MPTPITDVRGIGPSTATILAENGIATAEDLAAQTVRQVASIKTFSEVRAAQVIEAAKALLAAEPAPAAAKKAPVKKAAAKKKAAAPTATDQILKIIKRSKKGVDVPTLMKKTGYNDKKVRNIVSRAFRQGKIKRKGRGIYEGA